MKSLITPLEVFRKDFADISYGNALFFMLEDSMWLKHFGGRDVFFRLTGALINQLLQDVKEFTLGCVYHLNQPLQGK